jgi:hypothetical protein
MNIAKLLIALVTLALAIKATTAGALSHNV